MREERIPIGMHFQAVHLKEIASVLHDWGRTGLTTIFTEQPGVVISPLSLLRLRPYLRKSMPLSPVHRLYELRALRGITLQKRDSLRGFVSLAIGHSLPPRFPRLGRLIDILVVRTGLMPSIYMTQQLWVLAGVMAWEQPDFQCWAADYLWSHLRNRRLFALDTGSLPTLHPNTFWLLILLAMLLQRQSSFPRQRWSPRIRQLNRRLTHIARTATLQGEWAGFWDQWVIAEALTQQMDQSRQPPPQPPFLRRVIVKVLTQERMQRAVAWLVRFLPQWATRRASQRRVTLRELDPLLHRALVNLPIIAEPAYQELASWLAPLDVTEQREQRQEVEAVPLTKPDWKANIPRWFANPNFTTMLTLVTTCSMLP